MKQIIEKLNVAGKAVLEYDGCIFEIVDKITLGYEIWNIGNNMPEGYLPICRLKGLQPFEGGREIDVNSLRAIKTEHAQTILSGIYNHDPEKRQLALKLLRPFVSTETQYNKMLSASNRYRRNRK